jgi:hypothetical protein
MCASFLEDKEVTMNGMAVLTETYGAEYAEAAAPLLMMLDDEGGLDHETFVGELAGALEDAELFADFADLMVEELAGAGLVTVRPEFGAIYRSVGLIAEAA